MVRALLFAASALTTGYAAGRTYLDREIDRRKDCAIAHAADTARARLRQAGAAFLRQSVKRLALSLALRASLVALAFGGFKADLWNARGLTLILAITVIGFLVRDGLAFRPQLRLALPYLRAHHWHPIKALKGFIAAHTFSATYQEATTLTREGRNGLWIRLSRHDPDTLSNEVASAVAQLASEMGLRDLKPYILQGAAQMLSLFLLYATTVFMIITAVVV